jgi:hypothetical protein
LRVEHDAFSVWLDRRGYGGAARLFENVGQSGSGNELWSIDVAIERPPSYAPMLPNCEDEPMNHSYTIAVCLLTVIAVGACDATTTTTAGAAGSPGFGFGNGGNGATATGSDDTTLLGRGGDAFGTTKISTFGGSASTATTRSGTGGVTSTTPSLPLAQSCNTLCQRRIAMACDMDAGMTLTDCLTECSDVSDAPNCALPYQTVLSCMVNIPASQYECDAEGYYAPLDADACATEFEAFLNCAVGN